MKSLPELLSNRARGKREKCRPGANTGAYNAEGIGTSVRGIVTRGLGQVAAQAAYTLLRSVGGHSRSCAHLIKSVFVTTVT